MITPMKMDCEQIRGLQIDPLHGLKTVESDHRISVECGVQVSTRIFLKMPGHIPSYRAKESHTQTRIDSLPCAVDDSDALISVRRE